jgi:hypothetical protein
LCLEALEDRTLMSVVAKISGTTLAVSLTSGDNATHSVALQQDAANPSTQTDVLDFGQLVGTFDNTKFKDITMALGPGDATINLGNVSVPNKGISIDAGDGHNTLIGLLTPSTWTISGTNAGSINNHAVTFKKVENLQGGSSQDTFKFAGGGHVKGTVNGEGQGTLDYSAYGGVVNVNLQKRTATATGGFAGIDNVTGNTAPNTLTGPNADTTWTLTGTDAGSVTAAGSTVMYRGFANLVGGSGQNTFQFVGNALVSGSLNGGSGGHNTLDYSAANYSTTNAINFSDFSHPDNLDLKGPTTKTTADGAVLRLMTSRGNQSHNAFYNQQVSASSFSTSFAFRITNLGGIKDASGEVGADGLVFVLQNGSSANSRAGGYGGSIGYQGRFPDSIGIAFDTFENPGNGDTSSNELGIDYRGSVVHNAGNGATVNVGRRFDDGKIWYAWVDYDGTTLQIFISQSSTKPAAPTLAQVLNIPLIIGSPFAYAGFTSGTGAGWETIDLLSWQYSSSTPLPSNPGVLVDLASGSLPARNATGIGFGFSGIANLVGSAGSNYLRGDGSWEITGANASKNRTTTFSAFQNLHGTPRASTFTFDANSSLDGFLYTGTGNVTVTLAAGVSVGGGLLGSIGNDKLVGPNTNSSWTITDDNTGTVNGIAFANFAHLQGGSGSDTFAFLPDGRISGSINGGGGGDWLDYSAYNAAVTVNLATGAATGVAGGATGSIVNIQNVIGSNAGNTLRGDGQGNILIGGDGADTIIGGKGRSILIGGAGNDIITSGPGEDIIIGGSVNFGANLEAALMAILGEWQRTDETFTQRISNIRTGVGPGNAYALSWGTTVLDDGASNTLRGNPAGNEGALDWFFADLAAGHDTIVDLKNGDVVN